MSPCMFLFQIEVKRINKITLCHKNWKIRVLATRWRVETYDPILPNWPLVMRRDSFPSEIVTERVYLI